MNVGNEVNTQRENLVFDNNPKNRGQTEIVLRPEEIKMYKDCSYSLYYKAGIPFATFWSVIGHALRKPGTPPVSFVRQGLTFLGNVVLGTILFSPICYMNLIAMRREFEKQQKETESQGFAPVEESKAQTRTEDFSYPVDIISNLNESQANFSSDFNSSIGLLIDDEIEQKKEVTTYQDLRAKHRSNFGSNPPPSPSSLTFEGSLHSSGLHSPPIDKSTTQQPPKESPPRRVIRNKYGDEIE